MFRQPNPNDDLLVSHLLALVLFTPSPSPSCLLSIVICIPTPQKQTTTWLVSAETHALLFSSQINANKLHRLQRNCQYVQIVQEALAIRSARSSHDVKDLSALRGTNTPPRGLHRLLLQHLRHESWSIVRTLCMKNLFHKNISRQTRRLRTRTVLSTDTTFLSLSANNLCSHSKHPLSKEPLASSRNFQ